MMNYIKPAIDENNRKWEASLKVSQNSTFIRKDNFNDKRIFCLYGNISAGKTTFVSRFLNNDMVSSPTYTLCNQYADDIFHFDFYKKQSDLTDALCYGKLIFIENVIGDKELKCDSLIYNDLVNFKNEVVVIIFCNQQIKIILH